MLGRAGQSQREETQGHTLLHLLLINPPCIPPTCCPIPLYPSTSTSPPGQRQVLASHRLALRDAQLAAGRAPAPLQDQMAERLAQMEAAVRGT